MSEELENKLKNVWEGYRDEISRKDAEISALRNDLTKVESLVKCLQCDDIASLVEKVQTQSKELDCEKTKNKSLLEKYEASQRALQELEKQVAEQVEKVQEKSMNSERVEKQLSLTQEKLNAMRDNEIRKFLQQKQPTRKELPISLRSTGCELDRNMLSEMELEKDVETLKATVATLVKDIEQLKTCQRKSLSKSSHVNLEQDREAKGTVEEKNRGTSKVGVDNAQLGFNFDFKEKELTRTVSFGDHLSNSNLPVRKNNVDPWLQYLVGAVNDPKASRNSSFSSEQQQSRSETSEQPPQNENKCQEPNGSTPDATPSCGKRLRESRDPPNDRKEHDDSSSSLEPDAKKLRADTDNDGKAV